MKRYRIHLNPISCKWCFKLYFPIKNKVTFLLLFHMIGHQVPFLGYFLVALFKNYREFRVKYRELPVHEKEAPMKHARKNGQKCGMSMGMTAGGCRG